jgi:hypothetical protein
MIEGRKLQARGIVNHCQRDGAYLLLELRGPHPAYFLEPGSTRVRTVRRGGGPQRLVDAPRLRPARPADDLDLPS